MTVIADRLDEIASEFNVLGSGVLDVRTGITYFQLLAKAFSDLSIGVGFPVLGGEVGVVNTQFDYGDPRRFGASANGIANDTVPVQLAIDSGVRTLVLAPGCDYAVTQVKFQYFNMPGSNNPARGFRLLGHGGRLRQLAASTQAMVYIDTCDDFVMSGVPFYGNRANQAVPNYGIYVVNSSYGKMTNCLVRDFSGSGMVMTNGVGLSDEWNIIGNEFIFNSGFGFYAENCGDHSIDANHCDFNAYDGMAFVGCYTTALLGNHSLTNTQAGCSITGSRAFTVGPGNMFRENQRHGLVLSGGAGGHRIKGVTCLWNSLAGQGLYDGINADSCPSIHISSNESNDFYYASAGAPVSGVSRQRYGFKANNCPGIITDGANCFTPNFTGATLLTGTSAYVAGV